MSLGRKNGLMQRQQQQLFLLAETGFDCERRATSVAEVTRFLEVWQRETKKTGLRHFDFILEIHHKQKTKEETVRRIRPRTHLGQSYLRHALSWSPHHNKLSVRMYIYRYLAPRFCVVCPFCLFFRYVSRKSKVALKKSLFVWRLAISFNKSRNMKNVLLSVSVVSVASCDTRRLFTEYLYVYLVFSTILLPLLPHQVLLLWGHMAHTRTTAYNPTWHRPAYRYRQQLQRSKTAKEKAAEQQKKINSNSNSKKLVELCTSTPVAPVNIYQVYTTSYLLTIPLYLSQPSTLNSSKSHGRTYFYYY